MAKIKINLDGSVTLLGDVQIAIASDDKAHPYYKTAVQILHHRGLSPRGTRGAIELEKLLAEYDLAPASQKPSTESNPVVAGYRADLAKYKVVLKRAEAELNDYLENVPAEYIDVDISTITDPSQSAHIATVQADIDDLTREVRNARQRVEGLQLSIRRASRKSK